MRFPGIFYGRKMLLMKPVTFRQANEFIKQYHRHNTVSQGCKFCVSVVDENGVMRGVAIAGRPVSRHLDDGYTCEIVRLCTDGTKNCCSKLYAACCHIAREMGYRKMITYVLMSETGSSLLASGFTLVAENCGKEKWTGKRYSNKTQSIRPAECKKRYERIL